MRVTSCEKVLIAARAVLQPAGYRSGVALTLDELTVADAPASWAAVGFELDGDTCVVGDVRIRLAGPDAGRGLIGWSLRDVEERPSSTGWRRRARIARRRPSGAGAPQRHHRDSTTSSRSRPRSTARSRRWRPPASTCAASARSRRRPARRGRPSSASARPSSRSCRSRAEAIERGGGRSARLLLGPRLRRPRPRRDRRRARRPRQRDPRRGPARPPHRHPAPLRRPGAAGGADDAAPVDASVSALKHSSVLADGPQVAGVPALASTPRTRRERCAASPKSGR